MMRHAYTLGAGVLVAGLIAGGVYAKAFHNDHWATCTVTDKDRGASSDGSSKYRVYTRQCGVLADDDSWLRGKTNSADIWAQIAVGRTYRLHITGARFGLTSSFPNILAVREAAPA